jgi:hypothetical protein
MLPANALGKILQRVIHNINAKLAGRTVGRPGRCGYRYNGTNSTKDIEVELAVISHGKPFKWHSVGLLSNLVIQPGNNGYDTLNVVGLHEN